MKRLMRHLFATVLLACLGIFCLQAQVPDMQAPIPADTAVRKGRLENGLTYYIRHNAQPANQAEFYIYHDVGAMQEEDSQLGLAHFLEHMAFNGTKNLPGKQLINYLETIGVKRGANLNAGTGKEFTVYNISSVPLLREGIIDTALLILHDWSYFLTLDPKEIDAERGVIIEEFRTGNTAQFRINEKTAPVIYNKTKYADRNVLGNMDVLKNFTHDELVNFYHRWYRTDLQTLVIVGDFDVDEMEAKVKRVMADIPRAENPQPKEVVKIPQNTEPLIAVATDPELTRTTATVYFKREPLPEVFNDKIIARKVDIILSLMGQMFNNRLNEIAQKPDAPYVAAGVGQGSMTTTMDVLMGSAIAREGEALKALEALYGELEKGKRFGFTQAEFERAQSDALRRAEQRFDSRNDRRSAEYVWEYIANFRNNSAMPDAETAFRLDSLLISTTTLAEVNAVAKRLITHENQVVVVTGPEKAGVAMPSEAEVAAVLTRVHDAELEAYADNTMKEPLISADLKGSKVIKAETDRFGATVWTLSNGVKVIVKPTDFKKDEVIFSSNAWGGLSNVSDADYASGELINQFVISSGAGKFSDVELSKQLAGNTASLTPAVGSYDAGMNGKASPKDLETLLQLVYLYTAEPRFESDDFKVMIDRYTSVLTNAKSDPRFIFSDTLTNTMYGHTIRRQILSVERLAQVDFATLQRIYKEVFGNAADYTYTLVGNVDLETLKPMVEKYLGSLPVDKAKTSWRDDKVRMVKGKVENRFRTTMQIPKTTVLHALHGNQPYTLQNKIATDVLAQILQIRYTEVVREEKGGTYGVSVSGRSSAVPNEQYQLQIYFDTDPEKANELIPVIMDEIDKIAQNGPLAEDLNKVKEYLVKQHPDNLKKNNTWAGWIEEYYFRNTDAVTDYLKVVGQLDAAAIKALAAKIVKDGNVIKVVMDPAK